jgi:hypothetical protein
MPVEGVQVTRGEATGNTHWLHQGFESTSVGWVADEPTEAVLIGHPAGTTNDLRLEKRCDRAGWSRAPG